MAYVRISVASVLNSLRYNLRNEVFKTFLTTSVHVDLIVFNRIIYEWNRLPSQVGDADEVSIF